jgi:hypothetical protein
VTQRTASAAVLGAAALGVGMLLVQHPGSPQHDGLPAAARVHSALQAMHDEYHRHAHGASDTAHPTRYALTLALCRACPASQGLVRVLARRQALRHRTPPMLILADAPWPTLQTLVHGTGSTLVLMPDLAARVGITPAALTAQAPRMVIGLPTIAALVSTLANDPQLPHP